MTKTTNECSRIGYDPYFLGKKFKISLPRPGKKIAKDILHNQNLHNETELQYLHFSLIMSKTNKQAVFAAANIDTSKLKRIKRIPWYEDTRIKPEEQTNIKSYARNRWDRGHVARKLSVSWGSNKEIAAKASNDSMVYTNACMQYYKFNQKYWTIPEQIVMDLKTNKDKKICVITGPINGQNDRYFHTKNNEITRVPCGFWKVIAYINKNTNTLESQAYIMYQDFLSIINTNFFTRKYKRNMVNYQVSLREITGLTNLYFTKKLYTNNKLLCKSAKSPEMIAVPKK